MSRPAFQPLLNCVDRDWKKIFNAAQPVVIRNIAANWPCVSDVNRKWKNVPQLINRIGDDDSIVSVELGDHYMSTNLKKHQISLKSYLQYVTDRAHNTSTNEPKVYLAQQSLQDIKVLRDDVEIPEICTSTGKGHVYNSNIWFGGPLGTISPCHHDPFHNLLIQVFGEKEVTLIDPKYSDYLYPAYGTVQKNTSLVDFENPDLVRHSKFKEVTGYRDVIREGDAIYIPYKWWHYCKTTSTSCSVNYWWL